MTFSNEADDEGGPTGLVGCTQSLAGLGVEVFVKKEMVIPERIASMWVMGSDKEARTIRPGHEEFDKAFAEIDGDFAKGHLFSRTCGILDGEIIPVEVVVALQRLDEDEVGGEPDGPAPVGITAKHFGAGFARSVFHAISLSLGVEGEGGFSMGLAEGADAEIREKFIAVKHAGEGRAELVFIRNGDEPATGVFFPFDVPEFDILHDVGSVLHEPFHAALEPRERIDLRLFEHGRGHDG